MTFKSRPTELTPAERRAYAALSRDTPVDVAEEERTVRMLRARGVFGVRTMQQPPPRTWWRATAIVSAAAAGVIAVLQATRLHPGAPGNETRDTIARVDTHANAAGLPLPAAFQPDQRRPEKTSLLVWY